MKKKLNIIIYMAPGIYIYFLATCNNINGRFAFFINGVRK